MKVTSFHRQNGGRLRRRAHTRRVVGLAAALALAGCARTTDQPAIARTDVGFALHLPGPMQQALAAVAPGFRPLRTSSFRSDVPQAAAADGGGMPALYAAVGDFDHDGSVDAVEEGSLPGDEALHVFVILNGKTPRAFEVDTVDTVDPYDADAVGTYLSLPTAGGVGAFEVVNYPDSSTIFAYDKGAFRGQSFSE